jgi:SAM-dependent methyltransferase
MTERAQRLKQRYFGSAHPYHDFEREVERHLRPDGTLLDAGCGRTAPVLAKYRGRAARLIGVDLVEFDPAVSATGLELHRGDLAHIPVDAQSVDVVMARSVMEHVTDPAAVYREVHRVLRPGGAFVFLTANLWDYASLIALMVPNRLHPWVVARTEGRAEEDVFPIAYRTNTRRAVRKWAQGAGFELASFRYLGQYPSYFMFNAGLFLAATAYEKAIASVQALNCLQGWILATLHKPAH